MTVIKQLELTAFGKFCDCTVTLDAGLNKFIHHNEWGKSTLCDFILFMLYGIKATSKKSATLDEKQLEKYLPWQDNSRIAGAMVIEHNGDLYRIERSVTAKGTGKLKVYKGAGECAVKEPGLEFFGVDKQTFIRTFLVRQTDIRFGKTEDIESALTNLVTTGDEDVSFDNAMKRLDDLQRPIQSQKQSGSGKIPALKKEIVSLEESVRMLEFKKQTIDARLTELESITSALERAKKELDSLLQKEEIARANDAAALLLRLDVLDNSIAECKSRAESVSRPLTETEKAYISDTFNNVAVVESTLSQDRQKFTQLLNAKALEKSGFADYDLFDKNEGEITALVDKKPSPSLPVMIIGIVLAFIGVLAGALVMPALFVFAAIGIMFTVFSLTIIKTKVKIPSQYAATQQELVNKLQKFHSVRENLVRIQLECDVYKKRAEDSESTLEELKKTLEKIRLDYGIDSKSALESRIVAENTVGESKAVLEKLYQQRLLLLGENDETSLRNLAQKADGSGLTLSQLTNKKVELTSYINERTGALSALESARLAREDILREIYDSEQKLEDCRQQLAEFEYKNDVYSYVRMALNMANEKINNTYSPILSARLSPILSALTGGKYSEATVDKEFNIRVKSQGEFHALGYFSRGTADAVYFAVRLCMADILCESAPLILDDPFWSFDSERFENAMNMVEKISESRQVILFGAR